MQRKKRLAYITIIMTSQTDLIQTNLMVAVNPVDYF